MVPDPPRKVTPRLTTWPADQQFHRVYRLEHPPTEFMPAAEETIKGRFHFFRSADGRIVPVLYGAELEDAAIAETVLQQTAEPGLRGAVRSERMSGMGIVSIVPTRDLRLIELCGHGLQKLRLLPEELTSTISNEYPRTVAWAKALHAAAPEAHGLLWMSHQFNTSKALMLFGDRVVEQDLTAQRPIAFSIGRGRALVHRAAARASIPLT